MGISSGYVKSSLLKLYLSRSRWHIYKLNSVNTERYFNFYHVFLSLVYNPSAGSRARGFLTRKWAMQYILLNIRCYIRWYLQIGVYMKSILYLSIWTAVEHKAKPQERKFYANIHRSGILKHLKRRGFIFLWQRVLTTSNKNANRNMYNWSISKIHS